MQPIQASHSVHYLIAVIFALTACSDSDKKFSGSSSRQLQKKPAKNESNAKPAEVRPMGDEVIVEGSPVPTEKPEELQVEAGDLAAYIGGVDKIYHHCCLANLRIMSAGYRNHFENFSVNSSQTLYLNGFSRKS
jgi:hypothetical protein